VATTDLTPELEDGLAQIREKLGAWHANFAFRCPGPLLLVIPADGPARAAAAKAGAVTSTTQILLAISDLPSCSRAVEVLDAIENELKKAG